MKSCSNCEWSISPILEEEIMEEQGYKEENINRPKAGDCVIGMKHNKNYVCKKHLYIEGMEEYKTYCLYDTKYLSPGYLIVQELDDEIVKFFKLSMINTFDYPEFFVRGYEKDSYDTSEEEYRKIEFVISKTDNLQLYECLKKISLLLDKNKVMSVNPLEHGQNGFTLFNYNDEVILTFVKDVYGVKTATDFIDIDLGDNDTCEYYHSIYQLYNDLSLITNGQTDDKFIKKLIKK